MADGLNIHGDLTAIVARAQAAGLDASEAATVRLAEAGRDRMIEELSGAESHVGGPPARRTGGLARSVTMRTTYTDVGVRVHVGPTKFTGRILDHGWRAHGPVRRREGGRFYRYPFVAQVADESRDEAVRVAGAEINVHLRAAGF